jgi:hypothetical protein
LTVGVRFLLRYLSAREKNTGKVAWVDPVLINADWPPTMSQTFDQAVNEAISSEFVDKGPTGYALTDKGRRAAV